MKETENRGVDPSTKTIHISNTGFRDHIATVDESGKRNFLYPRKPKGRFTNYRQLISYILLAILVGMPLIQVNGRPFMMFNFMERKFIVFGQIFWPEDFFLAVLAMILGVLFIALFTLAFGRLFCGWVCPQTIFMEHVFRRIEYWIEGDRNQQIRLAKMPWNAEKIRKKGIKSFIFFIISFGVANIFMMYLIGKNAWWDIVSDKPAEHIQGLITILIFSGVFYFVFAWFREQVCIMVCPYGRLQGVLLDRKSIVIAYDYIRGEKRAGFRKNEDRESQGKGDCIDCNQCVEVCPTGIDIRNGTQLECINCTACIDACDNVMDKIDKPRGLIRYDSEENIATRKTKLVTNRLLLYSGLMALLLTLFGFVLGSRTDVEATIFRLPGRMYQTIDEHTLSNIYNYKMVNKTTNDLNLTVRLMEPDGRIEIVGSPEIKVEKGKLAEGVMLVYLQKSQLERRSTKIKIGIFKDDNLIDEVETNFNGPIVRN